MRHIQKKQKKLSYVYLLACLFSLVIVLILSGHVRAEEPDAFYIDEKGNVGIGTKQPETTLHLEDDMPFLRFTNKSVGFWDIFQNANASKDYGFTFQKNGTTDFLRLGDGSNNSSFPNGNVGIGTDSPNRKLTIQGSYPELQFKDTDGSSSWHIGQMMDDFQIVESGVEDRLTIKRGGNVGIGTKEPKGKLDIGGSGESIRLSGGAQQTYIQFMNNTTRKGYIGTYVKGEGIVINADGKKVDGKPEWGGDIILQTSNTPQLIVKDSGNVGIGTNKPKAKLDVNGTVNAQGISIYNKDGKLIGSIGFDGNNLIIKKGNYVWTFQGDGNLCSSRDKSWCLSR
jgi:hypothetical protein